MATLDGLTLTSLSRCSLIIRQHTRQLTNAKCNEKFVDIFVSKKLQFNNEKYSQDEWKKLGWHDLLDVSNLIQGSFSS